MIEVGWALYEKMEDILLVMAIPKAFWRSNFSDFV